MAVQMGIVFMRSLHKALNMWDTLVMDVISMIVFSVGLGAAQGFSENLDSAPGRFTIALLGFSLLCSVMGMRTFGSEKLIFLQREAPAGLSCLGYVLGRMSWDLMLLGLWPGLFCGFYYLTTNFLAVWVLAYAAFLGVAWVAISVGYLFGVLLGQIQGMMVCLVVMLMTGGVLNGLVPNIVSLTTSNNWPLVLLIKGGYGHWAMQVLGLASVVPTHKVDAFKIPFFLSYLGFCGDLSFEELQRAAGSSSPPSDEALSQSQYLEQIYLDPGEVAQRCSPFVWQGLGLLLLQGAVLRVMTYAVLAYKVAYRRAS